MTPAKDELVRAVFEATMDEVVALADRVLDEDDDGTGLRRSSTGSSTT